MLLHYVVKLLKQHDAYVDPVYSVYYPPRKCVGLSLSHIGRLRAWLRYSQDCD